ncbi:MAG: molybdopterin-dependent oxidoreductase [Desulfomonile tiedjei]|uniref:Molybdopterin-dependent oxidoreductase n=1 Tax=Desulfomonile tiedjei TaxID=2358 RepID=A0A9D6UXT2_9BACT|nr:molybdopterin-dependent oxidoreductase [Desulfomonile tiedjei]
MFSRRSFLLYVLGAHVLLKMETAWANVQQTIIPKGARLEDLVNKNPAELDTSDLDITPIENFGVMGLEDYEASLEKWRLIVDGNVAEPLTLSYLEVMSLSPLEKTVLLICPGVFAYNGLWKGVSIKELLSKARLKSDNGYVTIRGPEGNYEKVEKFSLPEVLKDQVFLAYEVNGVVLPKKHGFPLRVVAQNHYGSEWVKYVYRVTVHQETPPESRS